MIRWVPQAWPDTILNSNFILIAKIPFQEQNLSKTLHKLLHRIMSLVVLRY